LAITNRHASGVMSIASTSFADARQIVWVDRKRSYCFFARRKIEAMLPELCAISIPDRRIRSAPFFSRGFSVMDIRAALSPAEEGELRRLANEGLLIR